LSDEEYLAALEHAIGEGKPTYWVNGYLSSQMQRVATLLEERHPATSINVICFTEVDLCVFCLPGETRNTTELKSEAHQRAGV
jgi:hypothetical protein